MSSTYQVHALKVGNRHIINNIYLIVDQVTRQAAVVDPAWEMSKIAGLIDSLEVDLTTILLTHSHDDHVNLVEPLVRRYNPQVYMSRQEIEYYRFTCSSLHALDDFSTIHLGMTSITCLLTPGHTAGSACYLLSDSLFAGDTIFIEGCGVCDSLGGDPEAMYESVQKVKTWVRPSVRVYPGHSFGRQPGRPMSELLQHNVYFHLDKKEQFVKFRMRHQQRQWSFQ